ncbi:hypothetical protein VTO42DRAFT_5258 [Malbranchea cinnamomea]
MLAFESLSTHEQQTFLRQLSMDDVSIHHHPNIPEADGLNPFEAYSTFPSDPSPFIVHPTSLLLEQNKKDGSYPPPSGSSPLSASLSLENQSSASSSSSIHSTNSEPPSSIGSPHQENWADMNLGSGYLAYGSSVLDGFVDPSLIQSTIQEQDNFAIPTGTFPPQSQFSFPASPDFAATTPSHLFPPQIVPPQQYQHTSPQPQQQSLPQPVSQTQNSYPSPHLVPNLSVAGNKRRPSISSLHSRRSVQSPRVVELSDEARESNRCPHPDCGRVFRDLKAHMLTHQSERPEKCPIVTCEYHFKGFARKYDKNRHTLTHYKGTMVCGFCPGSGSAAEKSFNRADVFKRHLTSVHGVDQSAPSGRKKSLSSAGGKNSTFGQDSTGKCSTCGSTFSSPQDFYEHLDDCVLRVVQQEEPSEAINQKRLNEVAADEAVRETMERHMLPVPTLEFPNGSDNNNGENQGDGPSNNKKSTALVKSCTAVAGVAKPRTTISRRRNNRNNYPPSWGCPTNKMKMKRRLLCLYDGPRRLWKDEMMLDNEFEVRLKLPGGDGTHREAYVTDLDIETLKRAEGVLNATEEEKGPWIPTTTGGLGLIGPSAVPLTGNGNLGELAEEVNIEELMS